MNKILIFFVKHNFNKMNKTIWKWIGPFFLEISIASKTLIYYKFGISLDWECVNIYDKDRNLSPYLGPSDGQTFPCQKMIGSFISQNYESRTLCSLLTSKLVFI